MTALVSFAQTVREAALDRGALASNLIARNQVITGDLHRSLEALSAPEVLAVLRSLDASTKLSRRTRVDVAGLVLQGGRANSLSLVLKDDAPKIVASLRQASSNPFYEGVTKTKRGVVDCDTVNFAETNPKTLEAALFELFGKLKRAIETESEELRARLRVE